MKKSQTDTIALLLLMLAISFSRAAEAWYFLPNYTFDIRGIEARTSSLDGRFYLSVPEKVEKLADGDALSDAQKNELHWRRASFPHRDFVKLMPKRGVFGWYGCNFNIPEELQGLDVIVDLGIIDDTDEAFVNGQRIGGTGEVGKPNGTAWQTDRHF